VGLEKKDDANEGECLARLLDEMGLKNVYENLWGLQSASKDVSAGAPGSDSDQCANSLANRSERLNIKSSHSSKRSLEIRTKRKEH
jgi:hypothetical protein